VRAYVDLLPGIAASVFDYGVEGLGILLAASGAGALGLSVIMAVRGTTKGLPRLLVASIVIDAIAILAFAATPDFWVATALMVVAGGFIVTAAVSAQTLVQATVDLDYRGRVLAVYLSLVPSAQSIGAFVIGWIAEWTGLRWGVGAGAVATLLAAMLWGPSIWRRAGEIEAQAVGPIGRGGH
jgi:MFS family permease